jgi:hypothetical protein
MTRRRSPVRDVLEPLLLVIAGAGLGAFALLAWQRWDGVSRASASATAERAPDPGGESKVRVSRRVLEPGQPSRIVYLNREGAELMGGPDDAAFNVSSVVGGAGTSRASIPPFAGTPARWTAIAKCIREKFSAFDVRVVEQRPVEGDYIMAVLGGTPQDVGYHPKDGHSHSHAIGLAPFNGEAIPNAVVFIFTRSLREHLQGTCEAAGMEIAHAYGLDHARDCHDLMTYMPRCGVRRFIDKEIACGEHAARACEGGRATQNSYRHLLELLGPRPR